MAAVIVCPSCGSKVRAHRDRCPRCRQRLTPTATAPWMDVRRVAPAAFGLLAVAGLAAFVGLWRQQESEPAPPSPVVARPAPQTRPTPPARPEATTSADALAEPPFTEPNRGGVRAYDGGDYPRALELFEAAVQRDPLDAESWSNLGQVLVRLNRVADAVPALERAVALNSGRWAYHFNLARAHGLLGQWDLAVSGYQRAQQLYPDDYAIAFNMGLALGKQGNDAAAVEQFLRASALDPGEPTFQLSLAMSYDRLGRRAEAALAYRRTLELAPQAPEAPAIRARLDALLH